MKRRMGTLMVTVGLMSLATVSMAEPRAATAPMSPPRAAMAPLPPDAPAPPDVPEFGDELGPWAMDGDAEDLELERGDEGPDEVGPGMMREGIPGVRPGMGRGFQGPRIRSRIVERIRLHAGMARELNLTSEQREKLAAIREHAAKRRIQAMADLRIAAIDLGHLIRAERPDRRAIDAQIDRLAAMRAGLMKARIATRFEMRSLLTAAQQATSATYRPQGNSPRRGRAGPPRRSQDSP